MYLNMHQNNWSWTTIYMNSHIVWWVPNTLSVLLWCTCNTWKNVILLYGVYLYQHESSFIIWCIRDIYHDTNHCQFNHIYYRFRPEVIIDHYSSYIEVSNSNDIAFSIVINNLIHMSINEFILAVLIKYQFFHFLRTARIKCIDRFLRLDRFWDYLGNKSLSWCISIDISISSTAIKYNIQLPVYTVVSTTIVHVNRYFFKLYHPVLHLLTSHTPARLSYRIFGRHNELEFLWLISYS